MLVSHVAAMGQEEVAESRAVQAGLRREDPSPQLAVVAATNSRN